MYYTAGSVYSFRSAQKNIFKTITSKSHKKCLLGSERSPPAAAAEAPQPYGWLVLTFDLPRFEINNGFSFGNKSEVYHIFTLQFIMNVYNV